MMSAIDSGKGPYKLKPILTPIFLDKFINVPILHPLRYHFEVPVVHCRP